MEISLITEWNIVGWFPDFYALADLVCFYCIPLSFFLSEYMCRALLYFFFSTMLRDTGGIIILRPWDPGLTEERIKVLSFNLLLSLLFFYIYMCVCFSPGVLTSANLPAAHLLCVTFFPSFPLSYLWESLTWSWHVCQTCRCSHHLSSKALPGATIQVWRSRLKQGVVAFGHAAVLLYFLCIYAFVWAVYVCVFQRESLKVQRPGRL